MFLGCECHSKDFECSRKPVLASKRSATQGSRLETGAVDEGPAFAMTSRPSSVVVRLGRVATAVVSTSSATFPCVLLFSGARARDSPKPRVPEASPAHLLPELLLLLSAKTPSIHACADTPVLVRWWWRFRLRKKNARLSFSRAPWPTCLRSFTPRAARKHP